ncbi:hypothetical protein Hanom_Chr16g01458591 [Helianthus anomalus]
MEICWRFLQGEVLSLFLEKGRKSCFFSCQACFSRCVRRVAATRPKHAVFPFLSPDVSSPGWSTVCLLTVHYPIALNAMGINTWQFQQKFHLGLQSYSNFKNLSSSFLQISSHLSDCSYKMSIASKPVSTKKRKSNPKNPPGPNQAVINLKEEELYNLIQNFAFPSD